ncbi:uncharacterized protein BCR38DRAFT_523478 [Pseudomassariella vexata]|uniref:Uncharacterized protein n=1 Tax=Pseudomassariella vexata TaxID=1141098 RepID=A0A1Y2E220_9PEZI|nr:uncharacterized protein BCR38DRAFT_523478 [Pseudomassariella vexata]ORY64915.1 hypothetical protein BCR38DRAFT_523478 [Pseudomassariella vexata]
MILPQPPQHLAAAAAQKANAASTLWRTHPSNAYEVTLALLALCIVMSPSRHGRIPDLALTRHRHEIEGAVGHHGQGFWIEVDHALEYVQEELDLLEWRTREGRARIVRITILVGIVWVLYCVVFQDGGNRAWEFVFPTPQLTEVEMRIERFFRETQHLRPRFSFK